MIESRVEAGGCLRGAICDRVDSPFKHICHCHCSLCRRLPQHEGDTPA